MAENDVDNELLDYEEDEEPQGALESTTPVGKKEVKGSYVSIHSSGFRDFLLKPELLRAIIDCGFEHPSEGECLDVWAFRNHYFHISNKVIKLNILTFMKLMQDCPQGPLKKKFFCTYANHFAVIRGRPVSQ